MEKIEKNSNLPTLTPEGSLNSYLLKIRKFPMLEPAQEYTLAKNWREKGDRESAHTLVTSHLRLVAKIAMGYRGYGLPVGELISEGNIGLMQAVKKFDPEFRELLEGFKRQALHAKSIGFIHPTTKKEIEFECEKPKDFENLLKTIKKLKF